MRFALIEGPTITETCAGCRRTVTVGTVPYLPANGSGKLSTPELAYREERSKAIYCEACAKRLATAEDTARSITCYYSDTSGNIAGA